MLVCERTKTQQPIQPSEILRARRAYGGDESDYGFEWFERHRKHAVGLDVESDWRGEVVRFVGPQTMERTAYSIDDIAAKPGGLELWSAQVSDGERLLAMLEVVCKEAAKPSEIPELPFDHVNELWAAGIQHHNSFVTGTPRPTLLLMDEPDRSLSLPTQVAVYRKLKEMAKGIRVLVATHSIAALILADRVVAFDPDHATRCREALRFLMEQSDAEELVDDRKGSR